MHSGDSMRDPAMSLGRAGTGRHPPTSPPSAMRSASRADERPVRPEGLAGSTSSRPTRAPRAPCRSSPRRAGATWSRAPCLCIAGPLVELVAEPGPGSCVKAAVLPVPALRRRRFDARPRDALDRRGDGDRPRLPDRVRQGRAGRRPPAAAQGAPRFLSVRDRDKPACCHARRRCCSRSGSTWWRRRHRPRAAPHRHPRRARCARSARPAQRRRPARRRRHPACHQHPGRQGGRGSTAYEIRAAAIAHRVPCITTMAGACGGGAVDRAGPGGGAGGAAGSARVRGRRCRRPPRSLSVAAVEAVGAYTLLRLRNDGGEVGVPGQFFMLRADPAPHDAYLPRAISAAWADDGELAFLLDVRGPGRARLPPPRRCRCSARSVTASSSPPGRRSWSAAESAPPSCRGCGAASAGRGGAHRCSASARRARPFPPPWLIPTRRWRSSRCS